MRIALHSETATSPISEERMVGVVCGGWLFMVAEVVERHDVRRRSCRFRALPVWAELPDADEDRAERRIEIAISQGRDV